VTATDSGALLLWVGCVGCDRVGGTCVFSLGYRVKALGFRVWGQGFGVNAARFRVQGAGCRM
jgi:surface antigen